MAQGKVVKTPTLSTAKPVPLFKEMPTVGLSPDTSFAPDPGIPATMFAMPPDGGNPFQLDVAPPPMDFSNVSGNGGDFGGVLPDGIFSPAEMLRRRQEAEDKIQKAVLRPYLDLSQIPMEQMLPVPEELPYTSDKPAMAAAGIMGILGGDFGARAGANAAARYTQAADAVRKEREARDFARNQLQNELIQQRNQMALKKGDLQNDDIARYNQEQLRRESAERKLLEDRFANEARAWERHQIEQGRRDALKEKQDLEREKLAQTASAKKAQQAYQYIKLYTQKSGALTPDELKALKKWTQDAIELTLDPALAHMVPLLSEMTAEAKQRIALQGQQVKINRDRLEAWVRAADDRNATANRRITSAENMARQGRQLRKELEGIRAGKNSNSNSLRNLSVQADLSNDKISRAQAMERRILRLTQEQGMLLKNTQFQEDYIDPVNPAYNGLNQKGREQMRSRQEQIDALRTKADDIYAQVDQEQRAITQQLQGLMVSSPQPNPTGASAGGAGKNGSNVRTGTGGGPGSVAPARVNFDKAFADVEKMISDAQKNRKK